MSEYTENHDRNIDENLRSAAPSLGMPGAPSAEQIAAWRTPGAIRIDDAPMARRRPRFRWVAAGSAAAATLAIGAVLFTQTSGSTVQASTILQNLRQKQVKGVDLTFNNVGMQGIALNGVVKMRSKHSVTIDQLDTHDPFAPGEFGGMHAMVNITTDATYEAFPNTQWHGECAFSDRVGWAYLRMGNAAADAMVKAMPESAMLTSMARNGVVLNIGPITEELLKQIESMGGVDSEEKLNDLSDEDVASINAATANFEKQTGDPGKQLVVERDADGKRRVRVTAGVRAGGNGVGAHVGVNSSDAALDVLTVRLLNGTARQAELDQLKTQLNAINQDATVQNLGGGKYLLTADLNDPENPQNGREATLKVRYEENGGVQWAEVGNFRHATGTVRIEFMNDDIEPAMLEYQRLVEVGKTGYVDLNMIKMMMGVK